MLAAGNIQLECHETIQEVGALHEPDETHKHNELWFVQQGHCELTIDGVTRKMNPGDVGLVCAGHHHYIRNAGDTQCTYFVVTLGPPEQYYPTAKRRPAAYTAGLLFFSPSSV